MDEARYQRHLAKAKEWTIKTLLRKTAIEFQKAIRAEAGAFVGHVRCVVDGEMATRYSPRGKCVCVTCGKLVPWSGDVRTGKPGIDAGHFLGSRRASIVLEPLNCHPQCRYCNQYLSGNPDCFELYMRTVFGQDVIDNLRDLKNNVSKKWEREELVAKRIGYLDRVKAAKELMK